MNTEFLVLKNIHKQFGKTTVLNDLSLSIPQGQMVTLLGPSGCGKTTVLRLIAGLESPDSGQILIEGEDVTQRSVQARDIGIVFQSYALFPHLSIGDNVGYGLKVQGVPKAERDARVKEALALVDLNGFEHRFVDQLSGGQQQRVALARALILKPKVLLFDEPLSNLDANLRRAMREKIRELQQRLNITAVYVTHDQSEAFAVSDQVIVMDKGEIKQQDTAEKLYRQPNSLFVAHFMGESTILSGRLHEQTVQIGHYTFTLPHAAQFHLPNGDCLVGIRPESITLQTAGDEKLRCEVRQAVYMGNHWEVELGWQEHTVRAHLMWSGHLPPPPNYLHLNPHGLFLLPHDH